MLPFCSHHINIIAVVLGEIDDDMGRIWVKAHGTPKLRAFAHEKRLGRYAIEGFFQTGVIALRLRGADVARPHKRRC